MSSHEKEGAAPTASHVGGLATTQDVERIEAPVTWKAYLICAFASFGGIFFGYDSGYINGVLGSKIFIQALDATATKVSESNTSLIVSILSCGTFFGALIAGDLADFMGRKWTVILGCLIYMVGVIIQMITGLGDALGVIVAGRLIAGIGVGFESAIVILYMSEIVSFPPALSIALSKLTIHSHSAPARSVVRSSPATSSASPSVSCSPRASCTPPRSAPTLARTASRSPSSSPGPSSWAAV